jgi:hypothetical protein
MWDRLSYGDIQRAKDELELNREEVLRRQLRELEALAAEESELDALAQLIVDFTRKFKEPSATEAERAAAVKAAAPDVNAEAAATPATAPGEDQAAVTESFAMRHPAAPPPVPPPPPLPTSHHHAAVHRHPRTRHGEERQYGHTNFDSFNRALSKSL